VYEYALKIPEDSGHLLNRAAATHFGKAFSFEIQMILIAVIFLYFS